MTCDSKINLYINGYDYRHENEQNKRIKAQKTRTPPKPEGHRFTKQVVQSVLRLTIVSQTIAICAVRQVILRKSGLDVNSR